MGSVDYDKVAQTYQAGRGPIADIEMCRGVVQPHFPRRPDGRLRVLDLGAGTGIFTRAWPEWGATHVVAVDPTAAMLAEAVRVGVPDAATVVRARAEAVPAAGGVVDVAWLSATFHHFTGPAQAVAELQRVVAPGGVVFVRAFYPDIGPAPGYWEFFPGAHESLKGFRNLTDLAALFAAGDLALRTVETTPQPARDRRAAIEWVGRMRNADSFLVDLGPAAVDAGLAALEASDLPELDGGAIHIAVFERSAA